MAAGDVLWLFAGTIDNPKNKMHVCVCVADGWFLRINSRAHWPGSFPLSCTTETFLKHDSFLECSGIVEFDTYPIEQSLEANNGRPLASLCNDTITALIAFVATVRQLNQREKDTITRDLTAALAARSA